MMRAGKSQDDLSRKRARSSPPLRDREAGISNEENAYRDGSPEVQAADDELGSFFSEENWRGVCGVDTARLGGADSEPPLKRRHMRGGSPSELGDRAHQMDATAREFLPGAAEEMDGWRPVTPSPELQREHGEIQNASVAANHAEVKVEELSLVSSASTFGTLPWPPRLPCPMPFPPAQQRSRNYRRPKRFSDGILKSPTPLPSMRKTAKGAAAPRGGSKCDSRPPSPSPHQRDAPSSPTDSPARPATQQPTPPSTPPTAQPSFATTATSPREELEPSPVVTPWHGIEDFETYMEVTGRTQDLIEDCLSRFTSEAALLSVVPVIRAPPSPLSTVSTMSSSPPALDPNTLALLDSFIASKTEEERRFNELAEQAAARKPMITVDEYRLAFGEDWQLSQFWYTTPFAMRFARVVHSLCTPSTSIAFLCCPTAFVAFQNTNQLKNARLLEVDGRFGSVDIAVVDPPFLNEYTNANIVTTLRQILRPGGKLLLMTSVSIAPILERLYDSAPLGPLRQTKIEVVHSRLRNDFACWGSWAGAEELGADEDWEEEPAPAHS
ncbi:hypothetical protein B0H17DRAFT_1335405 [Mycena rosella]|uniref:N6-adenine methyltransferase-domain-containing protein n=1 Tax=Mycena rosella TaxID=1033263 RepID=A0AAD7GA78_MYCRO|nr:hypothetical protein B0H17DRAFT_1335405 [Mycena rosella]